MNDAEFAKFFEFCRDLINASPQTVAREGVENFIEYCEKAVVHLEQTKVRVGRSRLVIELNQKVRDMRDHPEKYSTQEEKPGAGSADSAGEQELRTRSQPMASAPPPTHRDFLCLHCGQWVEVFAGEKECPWCKNNLSAVPSSEEDKTSPVGGGAHPNPMGALPVPVNPDDEPW